MFHRFSIALAAALALSGAAAAQDSARDAYLEAWFQETAEGDLTAAVRAYQRCVELAGPEEAELVGRARLRMGRIAAARGDLEAARLLFERVVAEHAQTGAAKEAAQALRSGGEVGPSDSAAERRVSEATELLKEMLLAPESVTGAKIVSVFSILTAEDILGVRDELGVTNEYVLLRKLNPDRFPEHQLALAERGHPDSLNEVLGNLSGGLEIPITDTLIERASRAPSWTSALLFYLSSHFHGEEGIRQAMRLVELTEGGKEFCSGTPMWVLIESEREDAAELAERILDKLPGNEGNARLVGLVRVEDWHRETPTVDRLLARLRDASPDVRSTIASQALNQALPVNRRVLDLFLDDPEPEIRRIAIQYLLESPDAALRRNGIERFLREGPPYAAESIYSAVERRPTPEDAREFLDLLEGDLLVAAYSVLLSAGDSADVIREGLARDHEEMIRAALDPNLRGDVFWFDGLQARRAAWMSTESNSAVFRSLAAAADGNDLAVQLAHAVRDTSDQRLIRSFLSAILAKAGNERAFDGAADLFAEDPDPVIRDRLLHHGISLRPETRLRLVLDPRPEIAGEAIAREQDETVLVAAAEQIDEARWSQLYSAAQQRDFPSVIRVLYDRAPDLDRAALCLEQIWLSHPEVLVDALRRGEDRPNALNVAALEYLKSFDSAEEIRRAAPSDINASWLDGLHDALVAEPELFAEAVRSRRIENQEWTAKNERSERRAQAGRALAELGAVDSLLRLAADPDWDIARTGIVGLALLGETERVEKILSESVRPDSLLSREVVRTVPGFVRELCVAGRLDPNGVVQSLTEKMDDGLVAELFLPADPTAPRLELAPMVVDRAIDGCVAERAAARIERAAAAYDSTHAVLALFQLEEFDLILERLPFWPRFARQAALQELHRRTGIPTGDFDERAAWPPFESERRERSEAWRAALAP